MATVYSQTNTEFIVTWKQHFGQTENVQPVKCKCGDACLISLAL